MRALDAMSDRSLGNLWDYTSWCNCEAKVSELQRRIALAVVRRDDAGRIQAQKDLVCSTDAKMLAVKHVSDNMNTPGIDGVRWVTSTEKMKAAMSLTSKGYVAKPMRMFILRQKGTNKERYVQIPTVYDRAMQTLYAMSLDPVSESGFADKKSFAFRKGRSQLDAHAYIVSALRGGDTTQAHAAAPVFIVKGDVESFYGQISHNWLLANIPMDTKVLRQFLNAGYVFNGELFPPEDIGISLGCNISTILANMVLDGLQAAVFTALHGEVFGTIDYADGNMIRFADDIIVTARTRKCAEQILDIIRAFLLPRGLRLNEEKTQIIPLGESFTFLSRTYRYVDGIVCTAPSDEAVARFTDSLRELIITWSGSQKGLIERLNKSLTGWATYHKVSDARDAFRKIDVTVKALLLQLCERLNPNTPQKKLIERYFFLSHTGEHVYALPDKPDVRVISLADIILTNYRPVHVGFNPYLDVAYHETREDANAIANVTGKYKSIWERQGGRCHYCGKPILTDHKKSIVVIDATKGEMTKNLAYIHKVCESAEVQYIQTDELPATDFDVMELLEQLASNTRRGKPSLKFDPLFDHFYKRTEANFMLTFDEIGAILGEPLCDSAHRYREYWMRRGFTQISESWLANGYTIKELNLERELVRFTRDEKYTLPVQIPEVFLSGRVPPNAKAELENFFAYLLKKYAL